MREPDKVWEIPLWETNHSKQRLLQEEAIDFLSYKLGYEMSEETDDPTRKAYKHFDGYNHYPDGNLTAVDYDDGYPVWLCADFNRSPHCWALLQVKKARNGLRQYVVFDEIFSKEALTTEQALKAVELLKKWPCNTLNNIYLTFFAVFKFETKPSACCYIPIGCFNIISSRGSANHAVYKSIVSPMP